MNKLDDQIIRSAKRFAQKERANYANGSCLPDECPCYVVILHMGQFMKALSAAITS